MGRREYIAPRPSEEGPRDEIADDFKSAHFTTDNATDYYENAELSRGAGEPTWVRHTFDGNSNSAWFDYYLRGVRLAMMEWDADDKIAELYEFTEDDDFENAKIVSSGSLSKVLRVVKSRYASLELLN